MSGDASTSDPYSRWGSGVILALLIAGVGVNAIVSRHAYFFGGRPLRIAHYQGVDAICLGIACLSLAAFAHAHYFWSVSDRFYFISEILKPASMLSIVFAIGYLLVNQFVFK